MKKVLFIDRDGTLILEPFDFQVDKIEKLTFYPDVFRFLGQIARHLDYELVMVTNQDGLGTEKFSEDTFFPIQDLIIRTFENEGIRFSEVFIDRSCPEDNLPTRKPGTAMLNHYMTGNYNLSDSFVIGDRITDIKLAANLGCKAISLRNDLFADKVSDELKPVLALETSEWKHIWTFLSGQFRRAEVNRITRETAVQVIICFDGMGKSAINTGLGFFDHMLEQLAFHSGIDLTVNVQGDLHVDEHHTIEDTGLALGEAFLKAVGDKHGIGRYGFCLPMDDCLAQVAIDFGGRPWLIWKADFKREKIGDVPAEMFYHFFKSFTDSAHVNLNIQAEGENEHHKIEAIFKAVGRALRMAVKTDFENAALPSTKGVL